MEQRSTQSLLQDQQEKSLFLFVVVVGYIITFIVDSNGGTKYSLPKIIFGILCGAFYLVLNFFESELLGNFPTGVRRTLYFSIQLSLVLGIGWLLGPGGNWLIGLPLVALAVAWLPPRSRWFVYIGLLAAIVLPILHYSTWNTALMNAFVISTAIFFVAAFTQLRLDERQARQKAEGLALQLETANRRLAAHASQVEELAAAQERNRLAREIHDSLGHYLTTASIQIEAAKVTFHSDPDRSLDAIEKAHMLVKKGLVAVRESVSALRLSPVQNHSLSDAISALVAETQTTGVQFGMKTIGEPWMVGEKETLVLYRTAQEGLTNIQKHASASCVDIELDYSLPDRIRLSVQDDGVGAADTRGGFGLLGIRERVQLLGGEFHVRTQINKGFCLEVILWVTEGEP
ncbi:MAG: sensor histidine kinase [Bacteroidota bacterium]